MSDPKHPKPNDQVFDLSDLILVDITPDHISRLSKLRDGYHVAVETIVTASSLALQRAALHPGEVQALAASWADVQRIDEVVPAVEKLLELLHETRLVRGHEIAMRLGEMVQQIRRRADRSPDGAEILAPFEKLLAYQSAPALKAVATREKARANEEAPSEPTG
ncbi:hypothetical protein [Polyangium sorediatum]|uniref:DUSAM domain-containing protein n=1 Tax=Polyangium sorediatum TaxID=889274 RepID=A0ABT6P1D6_9BACT|nr:hypothetical protein [Polyangium sorediatum]MDI1434192.1 hypothetical protein [Polyangium sorediatum]